MPAVGHAFLTVIGGKSTSTTQIPGTNTCTVSLRKTLAFFLDYVKDLLFCMTNTFEAGLSRFGRINSKIPCSSLQNRMRLNLWKKPILLNIQTATFQEPFMVKSANSTQTLYWSQNLHGFTIILTPRILGNPLSIFIHSKSGRGPRGTRLHTPHT